MLRILQGSFSSLAHENVKSEISARVSESKKSVLIVPEQQTVIAEKEMAAALNSSAPLYFEATNFTRFANTALRTLGGIAGEYADKATSLLIMWRILDDLKDMLSITRKSKEINTGTVEKLLSAVKEMKSLSISPEALEYASTDERLKQNRRLSSKLSDLALVMKAYTEAVSSRFLDSDSDILFLTKTIRRTDGIFKDLSFFIEGFTSFTVPQSTLIAELAIHSEVTVLLNMPKCEENSFEYTELSTTKETLVREAAKNGVRVKLEYVEKEDPTSSAEITKVASLIWKSEGKLDTDSDIGEKIRILSSADPYEECDYLFADIKRRVMAGEKYSDFAVIFRNAESYSGIVEASAAKVKAPVFISKRRDLSTFEPIKLIYTAFAIIGSDFRREDVITYAKCSLSGVDRDTCDEFELYTECWKINGRRFYDGIYWNMNPDGYTEIERKDHSEKLARINAARDKIVEPLMALSEDLKSAHTVREYADALLGFLFKIELDLRIERLSEQLKGFGEAEAAEENSKIWSVICYALDKLVSTLGDAKTDRRAFESQLKTVISASDIGRIPAFSDSVTVGSADMMRLYGKKHVYLVGVNHGEFPLAVKESSYFTDRDKLTLSSLNLPMNNDRAELRCARELFVFTRAFTSAKDTITLMYSERGRDLSVLQPSDLIARITEITDGKIQPKKIEELPPCEKIYTFDAALENIDTLNTSEKKSVSKALGSLGYGDVLALSEKKIVNDTLSLTEKSTSVIYSGKDLSLTQSIIERYVNCPFSHFLTYTLRLSENNEAKFDSRNIGNFIHAVLERFFKELRNKGGDVTALTSEEKEGMVRTVAKKYVESVCTDTRTRTGRMEMLVLRLCASTMPIIENMCDEMRDCKFVPSFFELPIKKFNPGYPAPCEFFDGDHRLFVYGNIDRVDTYKHGKDVYVRVIDYKTGAKVFTRDDINEGKNLQMFLYLKSIVETKDPEFLKKIGIEEGGRLIPAGVIYVKSDLSNTKIDTESAEGAMNAAKRNQLRRGMILNDEANLQATSKTHSPVKITKSGAPDSRYTKYLYTEEDWVDMCYTMENVVKKISHGMTSGKISADPNKKSDPCSYCQYKVICRRKMQ